MKNKNTTKRRHTFAQMLSRVFLGGKVADEFTVADERYDSPSKLAVKRFFRKPLAVTALFVLIGMFALVIIGPMISPVDLSYAESLHVNVAPNMSMMKLPAEMKDSPRSIFSLGSFTIGVDKDGNVHTWGHYDPFSTEEQKNVMNIPQEVKDANILYAAAGVDHCIAIGDDGKVYAWGEDDNGQYGLDGIMADLCQFKQPMELINGKLDVSQIAQVTAGYQVSAILMKDGTMYAWGNSNSGAQNLDSMFKLVDKEDKVFKKIVFTNTNMYAISTDGEFLAGKNKQFANYNGKDIYEYIGNRKVVDIAATGDSLALLLDDGHLFTMGTVKNTPDVTGLKVAAINGGSRHFTLLTEDGAVLAWGKGELGQTDVPEALSIAGSADMVFSTGFQNYAFHDGKFVDSWGLKGYFMGTDDMGRDVLNRVINGGKMTMTIGAVAVIVSSIIGIIIGCLSGYFGGLTDLLLMRITEIFSAIPFLPFALVLSAVLQGSDLNEDTRIFIIMVILGLLSWTGLAKLVRGQILAEREKEFVLAAKAMGVKEKRIAFRHILPNIISVILVSLTLDFATCMLTESSLSYLGFGVKLPRPTWGNMLNGCNDSLVIQSYWWRWVFPALFLAVTVICINIIGDTLRDILDPKSEVEK